MAGADESRSGHEIERRCRRLGIPLLDLMPDMIDPAVACRIELDAARRLLAVPVSGEEGQITVAMADPTDPAAVDALARLLESSVFPVYSAPAAIHRALEHLEAIHLQNLH